MSHKPRIAVLLTCFNRRETTLACLRALYAQSALDRVELTTYLVDDASPDGTGGAVRREFPQVKVLEGDGQRFWCGGMRLAWEEAFDGDYDHYVWLNDDTMLYPDALERELATAESLLRRRGHDVIVTGTTRDAVTGESTYGGIARRDGLFVEFRLVEPGSEPVRCDTVCGNLTLVPRSVARRVGNLSSSFRHHLGDFDYGLRAAAIGIESWVAPGHIGTCSLHEVAGSPFDATLSVRERVRLLARPSGPPPPDEWLVFMKRHAGWRWPLQRARIGLRSRLPWLWVALRARHPDRSRAAASRG